MTLSNNERNAGIDFLRIIFCGFVCLFHWNSSVHFGGGYLGVDFFFILSGFLLMQSYESKKNVLAENNIYRNCRKYLWDRICRLYPHFVGALLANLIVKVFVLSINKLHDFLLVAFWEVTLLQNIGLSSTAVLWNAVDWYLCALLVGSYLVYYLLQKCREFFLHFIAPFSVMFMLCYFNLKFGFVGPVSQVVDITTGGMIRGFAELSLGRLTFMAYQYSRSHIRIEKNHIIIAVQSVLEIGLLGFITLMCYREGKTAKDFVLIFFFAYLIVSVSLNSSVLSALCGKTVLRPIVTYFGKLTYPMFLMHIVAGVLSKKYFGGGVLCKNN